MQPKPTPQEIERDLTFAIEAARDAGKRALGLRALDRWEGKMLADIGDQACDGYVQGLVLGRYPEDGILSEETVDSAERLGKHRTWIIDPLDGTKEFSQLRHDWAVHVALTFGGECGLAAVALPSQERILWGVSLEGHEKFGMEGAGTLLRGDSSSNGSAPRVAVSRSHTPEWTTRFIEQMGGQACPAGSAGNKVAMLMLGEAISTHYVFVARTAVEGMNTVARVRPFYSVHELFSGWFSHHPYPQMRRRRNRRRFQPLTHTTHQC
jgi:3'(2'), 5'-bisphosphate nucleotidase